MGKNKMAKLLKIFGKKAPHPPRPDYSGGSRKVKGSVSDSDEEQLHQQHTLPAYLTESPPVHGSPGHTVDRLRHASQSSQDSGTGMESTQATCPISPTKQRPVICDDYSDPKDVLRAVKDSGYQIPAEGPIPDKPYVEDDYSVPYEAQKLIQQMRMDKEGKLLSGNQKSKKSRSSDRNLRQHQYEEPPDIHPPTGSSPQMYEAVPDESITSNGQSRTEMAFSYTAGLGTVHEEGSPHAQENGDDHSVSGIGRSNSAHQRLQQQPQTPQNDKRPQGEYDNPWEWTAKARAMGGPDGPVEVKRTRSKSDASPRGRSSPESDTRPQEDYDQPWEWIKKDRKLSQAVTDKEKTATNTDSTPENLRRSTQSPKKLSKELKLDIKSNEINGEPVDPAITLEHQKWYHGKLSRLEAEKKLKTCNECSYLVRMSESAAKDFSLSLKSAKGYMHMKIVQHQEGFILGEFSKPFRSIPEMIHYYTRHKLNIRGAEHMALLHPVCDDLL